LGAALRGDAAQSPDQLRTFATAALGESYRDGEPILYS
jgi:hypothetical protein